MVSRPIGIGAGQTEMNEEEVNHPNMIIWETSTIVLNSCSFTYLQRFKIYRKNFTECFKIMFLNDDGVKLKLKINKHYK